MMGYVPVVNRGKLYIFLLHTGTEYLHSSRLDQVALKDKNCFSHLFFII